MNNKNLTLAAVALVLVTSIITFSATAFVFSGSGYFKPENSIGFDNRVKSENIDKFKEVRGILEKKYYKDVDENNLVEGAISGMADSLKDPYTVYFTKEQMQSFTEKTSGSYVGIGVSINLDNNGLVSIIEPFSGSPAKKAGIMQGDKITKVDDKDVTAIKDEEMVVSMIKGEEGTKVKITVYRPSEGKSIDFEMKREKIKISNIKSEVLPGNIGYIKISTFDSEIAKYFHEHLSGLLQKKVKGLIIDLRDNPGGDYSQVVGIAKELLPKGLIVYTEDRAKKKEEQNSTGKGLDLPIVALINGNSASASEILAGALKDRHKGTLVGTKSFGKGLVQSVVDFKDGSGLKYTIARYFTPSGVCIQGKGIMPDVEVKL
ncbi:MAG TPA: S41 family peptidase, partial [Clostridia bacterium]